MVTKYEKVNSSKHFMKKVGKTRILKYIPIHKKKK